MKHKLKLLLRGAYARLLYHTGLHALVNRCMPRRLLILAGHCVDAPEYNAFLPKDMKIGAEELEGILRWFMRRGYEVESVGAAARQLAQSGERSLLALSMDDGYRDNHRVLLPMLRRIGVPATVFLESRPLDERRINWSHKYFWILGRTDPRSLCESYLQHSQDEPGKALLAEKLAAGGDLAYHLKRVLKYDADPEDRDRTLDSVFREQGGDEAALCEQLYMSWAEARELQHSGIELGGHTVSHHVLATLDPETAEREVRECRAAMERELGRAATTFAYPFGRRWDYDEGSKRAVDEAGFELAVNTHSGTNGPDSDRFEYKRVMIDRDTRLHLLVAEACGGFDLLRRLGLNFSE